MSERQAENLSALMDGELNEAAARDCIANTARDNDMKATWSRYHLISDTLTSRAAEVDCASLSDRVSQALSNEPTVLAPSPRKPSWQQPVLRKLGGLAVAASVAAVAILGLQNIRQDSLQSINPITPLAQHRPSVEIRGTQPTFPVAQVSTGSNPLAYQQSQKSGWDTAKAEVGTRLDAYLRNHSQGSSSNNWIRLQQPKIEGQR